ncbi:MAG: hypothetical protein NTV81_04465, partial [Candidatus Komeilibacteria bacterium]|nr:hypothetical protein [Candidatus Komeilibacteria bacterium]
PDILFGQYTIDQAFALFQWLILTGSAYNQSRQPTPFSVLSGNPSCINLSQVDPIESLGDLRRRFQFVFLTPSYSETITAWLNDNRIGLNQIRWLNLPLGEYVSGQDINNLLNARGRLTIQLNEFHDDATQVRRIVIEVNPSQFRFVLKYGIPNEDSEWSFPLAETWGYEDFSSGFRLAEFRLNELIGSRAELRPVTRDIFGE